MRLYVRQKRAKWPEAFVPLAFEFGHAQADWGAAEVVIGGVEVAVGVVGVDGTGVAAGAARARASDHVDAITAGHQAPTREA